MIMLRKSLIVAICLLILITSVFAEEDFQNRDKIKWVGCHIGYNCYKMEGFNEKLRHEKNNIIEKGLNATIEFSPIEFIIPSETPYIGKIIGGQSIKLPVVGIEYLSADSNTNHIGTNSTSARASWELPVDRNLYCTYYFIFHKNNTVLLSSSKYWLLFTGSGETLGC